MPKSELVIEYFFKIIRENLFKRCSMDNFLLAGKRLICRHELTRC